MNNTQILKNIRKVLWLLMVCPFLSFGQAQHDPDDFGRMVGKHYSQPEVQSWILANGLVTCFRCKEVNGNGIFVQLNSEHYISSIMVVISQYKYPLQWGLKAGMNYGKVKKKLKSLGDHSNGKDIQVKQENSRVVISFFPHKKKQIHALVYKYEGVYGPVVLSDRDNDGIYDYLDSCADVQGKVYKYGCPLVDHSDVGGKNPDEVFNDGFYRIYMDYKNGFRNLFGERMENSEEGYMQYKVNNGISGFVDERIIMRDSNQDNNSYVGVFRVTDSIMDAMELLDLLRDKISYGQMTSIINEGVYFYHRNWRDYTIQENNAIWPYTWVDASILMRYYYDRTMEKWTVTLYLGRRPYPK